MPSSLSSNHVFYGLAVIWHNTLFGLAGRLRHPQFAVSGKSLWQGLNLYYHALGGDLGRRVDSTSHRASSGSVELSTHRGVDLQAWSEPGRLHLPRRINRFPTRDLNRELYFWLAAFLAMDEPCEGAESLPPGVLHLLQGIATTERLLNTYPSLQERYRRLCSHELEQRRTAFPDPDAKSRNPSLVLEIAIRHALGSGAPCRNESLSEMIQRARNGSPISPSSQWLGRTVPFLPVPLWAYRGVDSPGFRLPWFRSSRKPKPSEPPKSISKSEFDPEFVPEPSEGLPAIADNYVYPEWDFHTQSYKHNWCRLMEQEPKGGYRAELDPLFTELVHRVHRRFALVRQETQWIRHLESGAELDVDAYVSSFGDRKGCGQYNAGFYREKFHQYRNLSVVVLMDASRSTEAWVGKHRVIDIAKQSLAVLAQVLYLAADDFALYSFSSDSRLRVRVDRIKTFDDSYDKRTQRNLLEVKPANYTRIGPAIRHVGARLQARSTPQKLLLILSDGKPHDPTDRYEGKYALEDTRRALIELRNKNIQCFGLTIDQKGERYLGHLFGPGHYAVYSHLHSLPEILPRLYARLTDLTF